MPEYIGPVEIPSVAASGTFPVVIDFGSVEISEPRVIVHRFGHGDTQAEQRYYQGPGVKRFNCLFQSIGQTDAANIAAFYSSRSGSYQPFTLNIGEPDGSTSTYTARFAEGPITITRSTQTTWTARVDMIEVPSADPSYTISATETRAPSATLKTALLDQVQTVIPLIQITLPTDPVTYAYLSDRRVTVGGNLYQPRLLDWGGISQAINGEADQAHFVFGNADRVFRDLVNQLDLWKAPIEFALFHVGTTIKLDLWKGFVSNWAFDAGPEFRIEAHDGLYELRLPYPSRKISRQDGFTVPDQPVNVGGKKGISLLTATSVINDTAYGKPLKDIFVSNAAAPLPVECEIIAGRDESEFYAALGVVGRGPISNYSQGDVRWAHTLDGVQHHGPGMLGLRRAYGGTPSTGSETAVDNSPDAGSNSFALDEVGKALPVAPLDGVAFVQIRRVDEKGIQPLRPEAKQMKVWVEGGLGGWTWSGSGPYTRTWQQSITNPIWVAVNTVLRGLGKQDASQATQETYFDVGAAIAAAAVCSNVVDKLIGEGTETQYQFVGIIQQEKPLRDWIREILQACIGYYTLAFGKLKIGLRQNSSVVEAFTAANFLLNSLSLSSRDPEFNDLTVSFADEDYGYQQNTVTLSDSAHIARVGQSLRSNINVVGVSGRSQAARIVTTKLREELGGYTAAEQLAARRIAFKTTVLALNVDPGMVCSMTHSDMPGGAGEFRVTRWRLNKDYSIDLEGETTTDGMYDMVVGEKPDDVLPEWIPYQLFPQSGRQRWHPNAIEPDASDPIIPDTEKSFGLFQRYISLGDGSQRASVLLTGSLPVNVFLEGALPPIIRGVVVTTTGGTVAGGQTYFIAATCYDADNYFAPPSNVVQVWVPSGTNTNTITLDNVLWPEGTWSQYMIFVGTTAENITGYADVAISPPGAPPSDYVIAGPPFVSTLNLPNPLHRRVRVKAKRLRHPGCSYGKITAVSSTTITIDELKSGGKDYGGRVLSVVSDASDGIPGLWNFAVSSYNDTSGEFTVTPDPAAAGVEVDDQGVVLCEATAATSTTITDSLLGMGVNEETGNLVRILYGTGAGQLRRVVSNTATELTVEPAWTVTPDTTSIFVVELPAWEYIGESTETQNKTHLLSTELEIPVDNFLGDYLMVTGTLLDRYARESLEEISPVRMLYITGEPQGDAGTEFKATFVFDGDIATDSDWGNYYPVRIAAGMKVRFDEATSIMIDAPTGADCIFDFEYSDDDGTNWYTILPSGNANKLIVLDGEYSGIETVFADPQPEVINGYWMRSRALQVGSTTSGGRITNVLKGVVVPV